MSTAAQVTSRPYTFASALDRNGNITTINNVESLKKGIIKTSKNKANEPYTILLLGETGVGKSSLLELIANVLTGNDIDHYNFNVLDHRNEQHGPSNQSQTNSARLYEFTSKNGIAVRILDTPGLADTRGIQQDELHKKNIVAQIEEHVDSVNAILVLANGTVPRVTVGTDYALSTLTAMFPNLPINMAFIFTNVLSLLHLNFSGDTIPAVLKDAPRFPLNNPVALQRKCLSLKDDPRIRNRGTNMRREVQGGEQNALEMLVKLFDWLDGLKPQPISRAKKAKNSDPQTRSPHLTSKIFAACQNAFRYALCRSPS
jgi:GTP-binding protein EngB required for normal cell division